MRLFVIHSILSRTSFMSWINVVWTIFYLFCLDTNCEWTLFVEFTINWGRISLEMVTTLSFENHILSRLLNQSRCVLVSHEDWSFIFSKSTRYLYQLLEERKPGLHAVLISFRDHMWDSPRSDISSTKEFKVDLNF
jgi:hypothetical protein